MNNGYFSPHCTTEAEDEEIEQTIESSIEKLEEKTKNVVKKVVDEITEQLNNYFMDYLQSDINSNYNDMIVRRSRDAVNGLLSGGWKVCETERWLKGYELEGYRKKIYEANKDIIQNLLVDDLNKENEELRKEINFLKNRINRLEC